MTDINTDTIKNMINLAIEQIKYSYAPYSDFKVGAVLMSKTGKLYTGCNIENAAYTPTNCAERTAFFKAISEGQMDFVAIAVVGNKDGIKQGEGDYCAPCAVCRQVMAEFCDLKTFKVIIAKSTEEYLEYTLEELLNMLLVYSAGDAAEIIAEAVAREPKGRFLFLTLTIKNAYSAEELKGSLRTLTKAFNKLVKYKKVHKNLLGYLRSTEITVNEQDGSYNQHLHVLLFVKSSYFTGDSVNYIKQEEWAKLWQRALKSDYEPVVHVQAVKANKRKGTDSLQASAEETAKYEVKSADYMTADDERNLTVIKDLEYALAGTRQISYGGLFKQIKQDLKLEDVENGDLVHVGDEDYTKEQMEAAEEVVAKWDFNKQNYFMW